MDLSPAGTGLECVHARGRKGGHSYIHPTDTYWDSSRGERCGSCNDEPFILRMEANQQVTSINEITSSCGGC